jgi:hypothetical protein
MSTDESRGQERPYIVQSKAPDVLAEVIGVIKTDPGIRLVREIGPPGQPHTLAIVAREDRVMALKERFKDRLTVEDDRPLTMY